MMTDPSISIVAFYGCIAASALVTGISKAGFGGGVGILAMPLTALVMPAEHMLGVMLPVLIVADLLSNLHYLKEYEWRLLRGLLPGAVVGIGLGALVFIAFQQMDPHRMERALSGLIGVICLLFVGVQAYGLTGRKVFTPATHPGSSLAVGLTSGVVSTLSHSAGPIATLYLLQEKLEKRRMVGTLLLFFLVVNAVKAPFYVSLGVINASTLKDTVLFLPLLPVGTLFGAWMNRRLNPLWFTIIMYTATAATAGHLVYKALAAS